MKQEYKVKTRSGTTWQYVVSYGKWALNENFLRFVFNDKKELIIPIDEILSIHQQ